MDESLGCFYRAKIPTPEIGGHQIQLYACRYSSLDDESSSQTPMLCSAIEALGRPPGKDETVGFCHAHDSRNAEECLQAARNGDFKRTLFSHLKFKTRMGLLKGR